MAMYQVWFSTESFADYIIDKTKLSEPKRSVTKRKLYESDANNPNNFHAMPDHIKKILYLDAPDLIVEMDNDPIFTIEVSTEAGTGHNAFQRFARIAASVENGVPAFYVFPEAVKITRQGSNNAQPKWDVINPLIFNALDSVMSIYDIPALLFFFPSAYRQQNQNTNQKGLVFDSNIFKYAACPDSNNAEMQALFKSINEVIDSTENSGPVKGRSELLKKLTMRGRRDWMGTRKAPPTHLKKMSPLSATQQISTSLLIDLLKKHENAVYKIGDLLRSRDETIVYCVDAKFRGDPYPGALAAIDYLLCREGKTYEDRKHNLVIVFGELDITNEVLKITGKKSSVDDFVEAVRRCESKNLLGTGSYGDLPHQAIPRYYMQVRYGSTYSKVKHIRVYSFFADAVLFPDGELWRDA